MNGAGIVGVIAIDHDVYIRVETVEHGFYDEPFSLPRFSGHECTMVGRDRRRGVGAAIIDHDDVRPRKLAAEVVDDLADGRRFVEAGNQQHNSRSPYRLRGGARLLVEGIVRCTVISIDEICWLWVHRNPSLFTKENISNPVMVSQA